MKYSFLFIFVFFNTLLFAQLGASVDCINKVRSDVGYDDVKAARACGSATVACIDKVRSDAGYDDAAAARACSGQRG